MGLATFSMMLSLLFGLIFCSFFSWKLNLYILQTRGKRVHLLGKIYYFSTRSIQLFIGSLVILVGQIVDGIMTPIVGILSDTSSTRCGKRMPWYYAGFVLVAVSFTFMFQPCRLCKLFGGSVTVSFLNYALFGAITNIGWAMCQVSHMSLVPSISLSRMRRDMLNNLRSNFTFIANLSVLVLATLYFEVFKDSKVQFQLLTYTTVVGGVVASLFFIYHIREKPLTTACHKLAKQYKRSFLKLSGGDVDEELVAFTSSDIEKPTRRGSLSEETPY